ncbi:MAG: hypothetical protein JWP51_2100 [Bradyrhizobium sp.]|jgi:hypothetical protein|nr:hypothetical protein [Bradyrhizobium sp.]
MRKLILISAMVLVSAAAQAGPSRSLSLASSEQPVEQPTAAEKTVDQPAASETVKPPESGKASAPKADRAAEVKPKRRNVSTEARVIYELHRHGIYW